MKTATLSSRSKNGRPSTLPRRTQVGSAALQIRSVLVPVDFSPPSREAIEFSLPFVKQFGAELHLAHVAPSGEFLSSTAALPFILPEIRIGSGIHKRLKEVAKDYSVDLRPANIHALRGHPFAEICQLARDIRTDLIIIPTRGNTGLTRVRLGSTAERVVRYSPCPVLVLHRDDAKNQSNRNGKLKRKIAFKKILVPIDFSDCSLKGLDYAKKLAKQFGASLVLLHSLHLQYYVSSDEYARFDLPLLTQQEEQAARKNMRDLVSKTDWKGIKVRSSMQIGHAGDQICARAKDFGADLIVTSTHGATGFKHVLLGSTAEYVVRHASCPVLVVPSRQRRLMSSDESK